MISMLVFKNERDCQHRKRDEGVIVKMKYCSEWTQEKVKEKAKKPKITRKCN